MKDDSPEDILKRADRNEVRMLFSFNKNTSTDLIRKKFLYFSRYFFLKFFKSDDAPFHKEMDMFVIKLYRGEIDSFLNIVFRGGAKTTRVKLILAFCILNDLDHSRRYIKVLTRDTSNSSQFVTDIYNMMVGTRVANLYPKTFVKSDVKREETMSSFTTAFGVKITAGTVGMPQRGDIQDETRPDLIVFDDIEDRLSLMSAVVTNKIWINIDEAITGLSKGGGCIYNCNYISEMGNVHRLVQKIQNKLIVPIEQDGMPTWDRYTVSDIEGFRQSSEDFAGDYLCSPDASKDIYIDRESVERQVAKTPVKTVAGFKMFRNYDPMHRYAGGMDIAGGVGLDSSTSVFIDFDVIPAQVVGTFHSNVISPEAFGDEIYNESNHFGTCLIAPENNKYDQAVLKAKLLGASVYAMPTTALNLFGSKPRTYGWTTNSLTKSKMMSGIKRAIEDGLLELNDQDLINEARSYSRNDLIDAEEDARLSTRHHDILIAAAICWQMKDEAKHKTPAHMVQKIQSERREIARGSQGLNSSE